MDEEKKVKVETEGGNCAAFLVTLTTEQTLIDIKKKLCDPPAASFAACGDPIVAGLFAGAGPASDAIPDPVLQAQFRARILGIEDLYMADRAACTQEAKERVMAAYNEVAAGLRDSAK